MDIFQIILFTVFSLSLGSFLIMLASFVTAKKIGRYRATHGKGWRWYNEEWTDRYDRFAEPILYAKVPIVNIQLAAAGVSFALWLIIRAVISFA